MDLKTTYTFMPLPHLSDDPMLCKLRNQLDTWELFSYPFNSFPPLECHVSPPLVMIDGGAKLADLDLDAISLTFNKQERNETQIAIKERLTLLYKVWGLITGAKEHAKKWEMENRGKKRKRHQDDINTEGKEARVRVKMRSSLKRPGQKSRRNRIRLSGGDEGYYMRDGSARVRCVV